MAKGRTGAPRVFSEPVDWTSYKSAEPTKNEKLSENLEATTKLWLSEGYTMIAGEDILAEEIDVKDRIKCRYITTDGKARCGGIIMGIVSKEVEGEQAEWVQCMNPYNQINWFVQIYNIKRFFYANVAKRKKKDPKAPETVKVIADVIKANPDIKNAHKLFDYCKKNDLKITRVACRAYFE